MIEDGDVNDNGDDDDNRDDDDQYWRIDWIAPGNLAPHV